MIPDEGRGDTVPGCIAARLMGGSKSARGERGGVGLSAKELLAAKFFDWFQEGVMFFCEFACQRLKPVGIMGCSSPQSPLFPLFCNCFRFALYAFWEYIGGKESRHAGGSSSFGFQNFCHNHTGYASIRFGQNRFCT